MKRNIILTLLFFSISAIAQQLYPQEIESVLLKSGKNRPELEEAIRHYKQSSDSMKLKALYFLITNLDAQFMKSYFWADQNGNYIAFDDRKYPTYDAAKRARDMIGKVVKGLHTVKMNYYDIDSITSDLLIDNIDRAFEVWTKPWAKHLSFELFCEYILPYRVTGEPLHNWRKPYQTIFSLDDTVQTRQLAAKMIFGKVKEMFSELNTSKQRMADGPKFSPTVQCENWANLEVNALRSQGIPCSIDVVNYWATSSGLHSFNVLITDSLKPFAFDAQSREFERLFIQREPAKVLRYTYSKQPEALASTLLQSEIPEGILRRKNYIDVTSQYWPVKNVSCQLFPVDTLPKVAYVCVYNLGNWRPSYWGTVNNNTVVFHNMAQGAVYLPMSYTNGKLKPIGYPVAIGYNHEQVLKPDIINMHTVKICEQDKYLLFKPSKNYDLFYWDNAWKLLETKTTVADTHELIFDKVPKNALLILIPEYSQAKERPFIITDEGVRIWW
jgi:hypothetical protein